MNTDIVSMDITNMSFRPNLGSQNTIIVHINTFINSNIDSSHVYQIDLQCPIQSSSIFQILHQSIEDTLVCYILTANICVRTRSVPEPFTLAFTANVTREFQIMLPSEAAWDDALHKLLEKQRVESKDLKEEEEKVDCSICMENLMENQSNITRLPNCLHLFHEDCVFEWLRRKRNNSCPLCRSNPFKEEHKAQ